MSTTFSETVKSALRRNCKNVFDVNYITYYIGHYKPTREKYWCSLEEFCNIVGLLPVAKINWLHDIEIVGDGWWMHFDVCTYDWITYKAPVKPGNRLVPRLDDMNI